jgi:hypothetical protein
MVFFERRPVEDGLEIAVSTRLFETALERRS